MFFGKVELCLHAHSVNTPVLDCHGLYRWQLVIHRHDGTAVVKGIGNNGRYRRWRWLRNSR